VAILSIQKIDFCQPGNNIREENVYTLKRLPENDLICQQKSKYMNGKP
jgi:hypothetical protein